MNANVQSESMAVAGSATPGFDLVDWQLDTLVDLLRRRAAETPQQVLYTYLVDGETRERSISAAELESGARRIGQALGKFAEPGARVILLFEEGLDYVSGLFACFTAGLVAVSGVHPSAPRSSERLACIARDCGATAVLGQSHVLAEFQRSLDAVLDEMDLRWIASDLIRPGAPTAKPLPAVANTDLAMLQYTSGSSREPRGVMLSHRNILHNMFSQMSAFGYQHGDTGVSWLPFSHDMGLIGCVLMAVYGGGRCILLSPSHFLEDPLRWLRAISRYRATLSAGPNFAYDLCASRAQAGGIGELDLSSWAIAVNGAEPVRAEVLRRFAATFAPVGFRYEALRPSYGLAEATLLVATGKRLTPAGTVLLDRGSLQANRVSARTEAGPPIQIAELVDCGRPLPDQHLEIVDPHTGAACAAGHIGEVWLAGPSIASGYFGRASENADLFAGDLGDGRGPYYKTGDLGFLRDGALYITGRLRDLLIIRGKNYYPQDLEASAEASHGSIRAGCTACFLLEDSGELVVVAELSVPCDDSGPAISAAIREAIIHDHGVNPRRIALIGRGGSFKTPSGKIQRSQTRSAYSEGRMALLHESVVADNRPVPAGPRERFDIDRLEEWFVSRMRVMGADVAAFDPAMRLTDLGFDSLKIVELKVELEQDFGITVNIADLYAFEDARSLAEHIRAEVRRQRSGVAPSHGIPSTANAHSFTPPAESAPTATRNRLAGQRQRRAAASGGAGSTL